MKKILEIARLQFIKFKWHIIVIAFTVLIVFTYITVLDKSKRAKVIEGILETALDKRAEIAKASLEASESRIEDYESRIGEIDNRLKDIRDKKTQVDEGSSTMTLREISDAFEDIGY